jgi:hypothetical protein
MKEPNERFESYMKEAREFDAKNEDYVALNTAKYKKDFEVIEIIIKKGTLKTLDSIIDIPDNLISCLLKYVTIPDINNINKNMYKGAFLDDIFDNFKKYSIKTVETLLNYGADPSKYSNEHYLEVNFLLSKYGGDVVYDEKHLDEYDDFEEYENVVVSEINDYKENKDKLIEEGKQYRNKISLFNKARLVLFDLKTNNFAINKVYLSEPNPHNIDKILDDMNNIIKANKSVLNYKDINDLIEKDINDLIEKV